MDSGREAARQAASESEEIGLAPPDEDLLKPLPKPNSVGRETGPASATEHQPTRHEPAAREEGTKHAKRDRTRDAASVVVSGPVADIPTPVSGLGAWLRQSLETLKYPTTLFRIAILTIVIAIGCVLVIAGIRQAIEAAQVTNRILGYFVVAIGAVPLMGGLAAAGVVAKFVINDGIELRSSPDDLPDFSIGEWFNEFFFVASSFWLAAVPGFVMGWMLMVALDAAWLLWASMLISSLILGPLCLGSVLFNGSPLGLFSVEVWRTVATLRNRWIRYWGAAVIVTMLVGLLAFAVYWSSWLLAFLWVAMQLVLLVMIWWMIGELTGQVLRWLNEQSPK
jgi:hypothetical protein